MNKIKIVLIPVFIVSFICLNYAQTDKEFHQAILEVHKKQQNVGLAAVISQGGKNVFSDYLGFANIEFNVPVNSQTKFGIASITKLFTAVTLLKLIDEGKIELDTPVQKYIPEFPKKSNNDITIRMLATHESGIPHPTNRTPAFFATHYGSALEAMNVFINDTLLFEPGTNAKYSSSNYNLLAAVIERVTGKLFTEVVSENIFRPLHLINTSFDNVLFPLSNRTQRYSFFQPWTYAESESLYLVPMWDYSFNVGGGNIISTANELAKFGFALCDPHFLSEQSIKILYSEKWFGDTFNKEVAIYATGANPGLQAALLIYPEKKIVSVILSNTWGKGSRSLEMVELSKKLAQMYIDEY